MMGIHGFATKKSIREAVKAGSVEFRPIETSLRGPEYQGDGEYTVVGPDPYRSRKWYATLTVQGGQIVKVK